MKSLFILYVAFQKREEAGKKLFDYYLEIHVNQVCLNG